MEIRREQLTRYITPLREGGSLPALAEASDDLKIVVKFRGAASGEGGIYQCGPADDVQAAQMDQNRNIS